ncbi:MAG: DUF4870 domain-containing protein [Natronomonas sp.]
MAAEPTDETAGGESRVEDSGASDVSSDDRTWAIITHAAALSGFVIPFGNILGPLVVWLLKKDGSTFVDRNGKQALNFQITWTLLFVLVGLTLLLGIGVVLLPILGLAWLILVVLAMIRASNDEVYDYPLTLDLIS